MGWWVRAEGKKQEPKKLEDVLLKGELFLLALLVTPPLGARGTSGSSQLHRQWGQNAAATLG